MPSSECASSCLWIDYILQHRASLFALIEEQEGLRGLCRNLVLVTCSYKWDRQSQISSHCISDAREGSTRIAALEAGYPWLERRAFIVLSKKSSCAIAFVTHVWAYLDGWKSALLLIWAHMLHWSLVLFTFFKETHQSFAFVTQTCAHLVECKSPLLLMWGSRVRFWKVRRGEDCSWRDSALSKRSSKISSHKSKTSWCELI